MRDGRLRSHICILAQDLMALDCIPDLMRAGVGCFKIEGRLKGPEYVAITTAAYRWAVDSAWAELTGQPGDAPSSPAGIFEDKRRSLHQVCASVKDCES